uniref:Uncharacterized protein n=1 Tax=Grammatophora oceanica TaxID=210454 RepID=A0A7S1UR20_9STRA
MRSLTYLGLSSNILEGGIPTEIGLLNSLTQLDLWKNNFEGSIPTEIGLLTSLTFAYLSDNPNLAGRVPTELANLSNLTSLKLHTTQLTGSVPYNLCSTLEAATIDCDDEIECDCCRCTYGNNTFYCHTYCR